MSMCTKFDVASYISFGLFPAHKVYLLSDAMTLTFDIKNQ
jgi:hypothetical protein